MHQPKKWEEYLPLVEFSYNNGYPESKRMSPIKELYGRSCDTPISWSDLVNKVLVNLNMLKEMHQQLKSSSLI